MRSVGDGAGIDLMTDTHPPKSLYIEVRCVQVRNLNSLVFNHGSVIPRISILFVFRNCKIFATCRCSKETVYICNLLTVFKCC